MWRVFIIHVLYRALTGASNRRGCHGTRHILFRAEGGVLRDSSAVKVQMVERMEMRTLPQEATWRPRDRRPVCLFSRRLYSARRDFGTISAFQRIGVCLDSAGHRSLTAAKAATGFTRNCVLGFGRKRATFRRGMIRGFAKCFNGTLRTSIHVSSKVLARTSAEIWREVRSFYIHGREC